jgi:exodeoxyribonuclease VII large subunit
VATYLSQTREQVLEECLDLNSKLQTAEEKFLEYYENKIFNFLNNLSYRVEKIFNFFNFSERKLSNLLNEKIFQINNLIQKNDVLSKRLTVSVENVLEKRQNAINFFKSKIDFLNPENILNKGYAIIFSKRGSVLDSIKKIKIGKKIKIRLKDGEKEVEIN